MVVVHREIVIPSLQMDHRIKTIICDGSLMPLTHGQTNSKFLPWGWLPIFKGVLHQQNLKSGVWRIAYDQNAICIDTKFVGFFSCSECNSMSWHNVKISLPNIPYSMAAASPPLMGSKFIFVRVLTDFFATVVAMCMHWTHHLQSRFYLLLGERFISQSKYTETNWTKGKNPCFVKSSVQKIEINFSIT